MSATILVTGGSGYIGSHTIIELFNNGFDVVSIDNQSNSSVDAYDHIEQITGKRVVSYSADVCDIAQLRGLFSKHRIEGIIHFAAFKAVGESVEDPLKYYHNNIASLVSVLQLSEEFNVNKLIFSSSCSVYGNVTSLPVDENTALPKAESPYAYTKQIGEVMIENFCKVHPALQAVSLRYFNPVGAHKSGLNGESPINKPNNLVPVITATAIGKIPQLTIYGGEYPTRDGTCVRDYIHVSDVADAHVLALKYLIDGKNSVNYDVFNLGTGNGVSVLEAIHAFEKVSGQKLNYRIGPPREGDVVAVYSDSSKAGKLLGWTCKFDIDEMMRTAWLWERNVAERKK
ncbi:MAG: UDP-glucose 4-epimerase [Bacteroidetes bacterium]|jgi:UDP-glucose 4-epimerase|nr:UDP-glucose 4-epimerase [Bacteroidota bacterium]